MEPARYDRLVAAIVSLALCAGVILVYQLVQFSLDVKRAVVAERDVTLWTALQIDIEMHRFQSTLHDAIVSVNIDEDKINFRFDILYSRLSQVNESSLKGTFPAEYSDVPNEILINRDKMAYIIDQNSEYTLRHVFELLELVEPTQQIWEKAIHVFIADDRQKMLKLRDTVQSAYDEAQKYLVATFAMIALAVLAVLFVFHLKKKNLKHLEEIATDELTGCLSRRGIEAVLQAKALRKEKDYCVSVIDLNNLKPINDIYGHAVGDEAIKCAADILMSAVRSTDSVGRIGGDEFWILFECNEAQAVAVLQRAQQRLLKAKLDGAKAVQLDLSYGVCAWNPRLYSAAQCFEVADERMYEHKRATKGTARELQSA